MAKIGTKPNKKAYMECLNQKALINAMADAMWSANLEYVGRTGLMTLSIQEVWNRYVEFAFEVTHENR